LAYSAFARAGVAPTDTSVIIGKGATAELLRQVSIASGAPAILVDQDATPDSVERALADIHDDAPAQVTVFETSETETGRNLALAIGRPGAAVTMTVQDGQDATDGPSVGTHLEHTLTLACVHGPHPDLFHELAALIAEGSIELRPHAKAVPLRELPTLRGHAVDGENEGTVPLVLMR